MSSVAPKSWSVSDFERNRPHLTTFCKDEIVRLLENSNVHRIVIHAPVKSGKRQIAEYLTVRDFSPYSKTKHAFISAWHRKADEDQRKELRDHNMQVFSITGLNKADECIKWFENQIILGNKIIVHLDEADHGSGNRQILSRVWKKVCNNSSIKSILYTATPEEILFSDVLEEKEDGDIEYSNTLNELFGDAIQIKYIPPPGYCGAKKFIQEGLVRSAKPFFHKEGGLYKLHQGNEILEKLLKDMETNPKRNIVVLRLSYREKGKKRDNKVIYKFLENIPNFPELKDVLIMTDKEDNVKGCDGVNSQKIEWSNPKYWELLTTSKPIIIVIDQTSSRSTEWACHDRVHTYHDFRHTVTYSTVSQAQERVNHYDTKYPGGFQPIIVYGHKKTFELSAELIDHSEFLNNEWCKKKNPNNPDKFMVRKTLDGSKHPDCPDDGLTEEKAEELLQDLECYSGLNLSLRVNGVAKVVPKYSMHFEYCEPEEWPRVRDKYKSQNPEDTRDMDDPFEAARPHRKADGTWKGSHRTWRDLEVRGDNPDNYELYSNNVKLDLGGTGGRRQKICYKDGRLGIAFVFPTGETETKNTVKTTKSMYNKTNP